MNTKHTPGPWRVDATPAYPFGDSYPVFCVGPVVDRPDSYYNAVSPIAHFPSKVTNGFFVNDPQHLANAALIAAAPELLEALKALVEAARFDMAGTTAWDNAQSVIAKATAQ